MPKKILTLYILFLSVFPLLSQNGSSNRWSIDLCLGGTNAVKPYSKGYWSNTVGFMHTSIGPRYMFSNKFGIKLDGGYDRIKSDESSILFVNGNSLPFQSNYYRFSLQGVADVGRLLTFENFTDKYSMLFHAGGGLSLLTSKINPEKDRMVNFMFGFTPQYKINKRMSLNLDASFIWHIYQQYTFDMYNPVYKRGFDGFIANATVGLNIYLGKHQEHNDWTYSPCYPDLSYLQVENKKLDSLNNKLNLSLMDSDDDGVINAIDDEKDTPLGDKVNCRGVSLRNIDTDQDGVSDLIDKCIDIPGDRDFDGCPKKVYDAIIDSKSDTLDSTNIAQNNNNSNNNGNNSNEINNNGNNSNISDTNNSNNNNGDNNLNGNNSNIANNENNSDGSNNNNNNNSNGLNDNTSDGNNSNGQNNNGNNSNIANNGTNNNNSNGQNNNGNNSNNNGNNNSNVSNNNGNNNSNSNGNNSNVANNNGNNTNNTNGNNSNGQNNNGNNSNVANNNNGKNNNNSNGNNSNVSNNNGNNNNNTNGNNSNGSNNNGNNNNSNGQNNNGNNSNNNGNNNSNSNGNNSNVANNNNGKNNNNSNGNNSNVSNNNGNNNNNTNGNNSNGSNNNGNNNNSNGQNNNVNNSNNNGNNNNNTNGNNSNGSNNNGNNSNSSYNDSNGQNNNGDNNSNNSSNAQNNNGNNSNVANNGQNNNNSNGNNTNAPVLLNKEGFSSLSDINFELNQSGVNQRFNPVLNEIVSLLKSNPNSVLALEGHTDVTGETNFNDELSLKRANALKAYFVSKGIDPNRIQVGSFGESKPKYLNKTQTGRALNRRVEIYIKE